MGAASETDFSAGSAESGVAERSTRLPTTDYRGLAGLDRLLAEARQQVHEDPRAAESLIRLGRQIAAEEESLDRAAQADYLLAQILTERGEFESGLALITTARQSWLSAGQPTAALRTDLGRMQILDDLGRHTEALAVGQHLLDAVRAVDPDDPDLPLARAIRAHAVDNMGASHGLLGEHDRALQAYAEAEAEYRELGLHAEAARPLANRGVELLALGRAREARAALTSAVEGFLAAGDQVFAAKCAGFLAQAHSQLADFFDALDVLTRARHTLEELGSSSEAVRLQLAIAETYLAIGGWPEARHEASEAVAATTAAGMVHDTAVAHHLLGSAEVGARNLDAADLALQQAETGFAAVQDRQYEARAALTRAEVAAARGGVDEAMHLLERAAEELTAGGWLIPLAGAHLRLSDLTDAGPAREHLDRAGELVEQLGLPQLRYQYRLRAAQLAHREGDHDEAERLLRLAIADLDLSVQGLVDHALRTAFRAERLTAYDELVAVLLDRGRPGDDAQARSAAGEAKAATLRDLAGAAAGVGPRLDGHSSELTEAYADLGATYSALQAAADREHRVALVTRMDRLEERVSALRLRERSEVRPAPLLPVLGATAAPTGVASYEFHVTGDDLVIFVSGPGGARTYRRPGVVPDITALLDQLEDQWTRFQLGATFRDRHRDLLLQTSREVFGALYMSLLGPIAEIKAPADVRIVPHGLLGQVPFAGLYDGQRHLVEHGSITVCPTPGAPAPDRIRTAGALVIGVADERAPAAATEAAALAEQLPGAQLLAGDHASVAAFLAEAPGRGLIHLACHGVFREANPLFSRIRLADRWVTCAEILHLDLTGSFVVLSACESGQHRQAAEPVGLGWAFLAAGASGVIVSHCKVDDATTERLMRHLYRALVAGEQPAAALRTAQLAVAADQPHPFYWSPFSYVASPQRRARST